LNKNVTAEKSFTETAMLPKKPVTMLKRIGGTTYQVSVHFNPNSRETVNEKIIRMIKNETAGKAAGE